MSRFWSSDDTDSASFWENTYTIPAGVIRTHIRAPLKTKRVDICSLLGTRLLLISGLDQRGDVVHRRIVVRMFNANLKRKQHFETIYLKMKGATKTTEERDKKQTP